MSVTLYPELIDYICDFGKAFMTDKERKASLYVVELRKLQKKQNQKGHLSFAKDSIALLADGELSFKEKVAKRIYSEHKDELNLNLCPKCFKIARTPNAKQCRFCFHNWH